MEIWNVFRFIWHSFCEKIPGANTGDFSRHIMVYKFHMDYSPVQ